MKLAGGTLTAHPPAVPGGPPDGRTTIRLVRFTIPARTGDGGAHYITTPTTCPSDGLWSSRLTVKYETAPTPFSLLAATPCELRRKAKRKPRIKLSVRPRRAVAGERTRFRIRARSKSPACRRGVRIRLGGKRKRTSNRGRARITFRFASEGRRVVRAAKRGCRGDRARIRIR